MMDVLYAPKLSYNSLSVTKAAKAGKVTQFIGNKCEIIGKKSVIVVAIILGSVYHFNCDAQTVKQ